MDTKLNKLINRIGKLGFQFNSGSTANVHLNDNESVVAYITNNCAIVKNDYYDSETRERWEILITAEYDADGFNGQKLIIENDSTTKYEINENEFFAEADKMIKKAE